jgi:hypothetical protein
MVSEYFIWLALIALGAVGVGLLFAPIVPVRNRRNKPQDGLAITPEVEKARQNHQKAVTNLQDGRG